KRRKQQHARDVRRFERQHLLKHSPRLDEFLLPESKAREANQCLQVIGLGGEHLPKELLGGLILTKRLTSSGLALLDRHDISTKLLGFCKFDERCLWLVKGQLLGLLKFCLSLAVASNQRQA